MTVRLLLVVTIALALRTCACAQTEEQWQATGDLIKAEVNRIAVFADQASEHKSRLLVASGNAAELTCGGFVMLPSAGWGYMPFATAYPVSEPFAFDIGSGVECRILGAVVLGVGGTMLGARQKVDPGVYVVAFQPESQKTSKAILLIDLRMSDDGRPEYKVLGKGALDRRPTDRGAAQPYVEAWFPDTNLFDDGSTCTTLKIDMAWKSESYMFRLVDMNIWMG